MGQLKFHGQIVSIRSAKAPLIFFLLLAAGFNTVMSLTGCALVQPSDHESVVQIRLNGRGAVPVSADNPYLAANVFLQSETSRSQQLAGFIKLRGMPQRLEYSKSFFGEPKLVLYYDRLHEAYDAIKTSGIWVFDGPRSIDRKSQVVINQKIEPMLPPQMNESEPLHPEEPSTPVPPTGFHSELDTPKNPSALTDALAHCRALPKLQDAERSPGGDLIHYVTDERETPTLLAEWYTGEKAPAETLMRLNRLTSKREHPLSVGDQIVIPKYLVKHGKRLSAEALRCILLH